MKTLIGFIAGLSAGAFIVSVLYLHTPIIKTMQWKANGELSAEVMCAKHEAEVWHSLYRSTREQLFKYEMKEAQGVGKSRG